MVTGTANFGPANFRAKGRTHMASLLGSLIYAGQQTLLTTQASLGSINAVANLYSINAGFAVSGMNADSAFFQPGFLAQGTGALGGGIGFGGCTLTPLLFTMTGGTTVWYNPNTTALPGVIQVQLYHTRIR
jgi:hypothetical protein